MRALNAERLREYWRLTRFDRPIGILLLLWPTLWALWIAGSGRPDVHVVAVFVAGVVLMRAAGCAINDFADRDFDPHVERTRGRPLAARTIAPREALAVAAALALVAPFVPEAPALVTALLDYTPNGEDVEDQTKLGVIWCKERPKTEVTTTGISNVFFRIPPGAECVGIDSTVQLPAPCRRWMSNELVPRWTTNGSTS